MWFWILCAFRTVSGQWVIDKTLFCCERVLIFLAFCSFYWSVVYPIYYVFLLKPLVWWWSYIQVVGKCKDQYQGSFNLSFFSLALPADLLSQAISTSTPLYSSNDPHNWINHIYVKPTVDSSTSITTKNAAILNSTWFDSDIQATAMLNFQFCQFILLLPTVLTKIIA